MSGDTDARLDALGEMLGGVIFALALQARLNDPPPSLLDETAVAAYQAQRQMQRQILRETLDALAARGIMAGILHPPDSVEE